MKHMLCFLALTILFSANTNAQSSATIDYDLQSTDQILLEEVKEITLYRTEYVDGTCTRQEPYEDTVCNYETRYRNECSWVPGRNVCRNENDYQCRDVRRTRRECKPGPVRRECKRERARRVCRTRNGQERCTNVPGREVCRNVSGPQVCRDVPYTDRDCRNVSRRVCDWVPGGNECRNVPYQEHVCRDITRYRDVNYACKKPIEVPYQAEKLFSHAINFNYTDKEQIGKAQIKLALDQNGQVKIKFNNLNSEQTYIQLLKRDKHVITSSNSELKTEEDIKVNFGNLKKLLRPLSVEQKSLWMNKQGDFKLKVNNSNLLKGAVIEIDVKKESSGNRHFKKTFNYDDFTSSEKELSIDLSNYGFDKLVGFLGKGVKLKVYVTIKVEQPKKLTSPVEQELQKTKSFNIKVYKNKSL